MNTLVEYVLEGQSVIPWWWDPSYVRLKTAFLCRWGMGSWRQYAYWLPGTSVKQQARLKFEQETADAGREDVAWFSPSTLGTDLMIGNIAINGTEEWAVGRFPPNGARAICYKTYNANWPIDLPFCIVCPDAYLPETLPSKEPGLDDDDLWWRVFGVTATLYVTLDDIAAFIDVSEQFSYG